MEHYVTYFDSLFLPQGLALHMSMQRHACEYTLWILCVDDNAHNILENLALPNVRLLQLSKLETEDLRAVKPTRSKGEYCWTLTPFTPRFVFEADANVERVTYIDADIWFRKSPAPIFNEFAKSKAGVLLTDHGYSPEYDSSATTGQYCVQFMTFDRVKGEIARKWWEERCIEWCYARVEDGKFGDQKYLDDWPTRFEGIVHVLERQELAQAPWNATRYAYGHCVFYHFHALRIGPSRTIDFRSSFRLPKVLIQNVYDFYVRDLVEAIKILEKIGFEAPAQIKAPSRMNLLRMMFSGIYRELLGFLNVRKY
jgi:hypothetical protein